MRTASPSRSVTTTPPSSTKFGATASAVAIDADRVRSSTARRMARRRWRGPGCTLGSGGLTALPEDVRERYRDAIAAAEQRGTVGLHLLPDLRLQELALIVHQRRVRSTRLSELAQALTDELIHQEQWFPVSLDSDRTYG